jgi:enoyl-CoA hydratase
MSDLVTYSEEEHYCLLQMDDGKANAMGFAMLSQLNAALDRAEQAAKVVVIAGRPGKFSAGFDLAVMANRDQDTVRLLRAGAGLSRRLLDFTTPVVLAVSGHALAMGALLILSADYRIGSQGNYKIGLNEVAIGMTLPWFGVELARSRLSKRHFHKAVNLAQIYDADGATEAGYLDEAVPEDELLPRATALAQQLAGLDLEAHRNTKDRTCQELKVALEEAIEREFAG